MRLVLPFQKSCHTHVIQEPCQVRGSSQGGIGPRVAADQVRYLCELQKKFVLLFAFHVEFAGGA